MSVGVKRPILDTGLPVIDYGRQPLEHAFLGTGDGIFLMILRFASICIFPLLLTACIGSPTSGLDRFKNALIEGEIAVDDQPIILNVRGGVNIEVDSFGGSYKIVTDPSLDGIYIDPVRRSAPGINRRGEALDDLEKLMYRIELVKSEMGQETLRIRSWSEDDEPHYQAVDFRIRVPELNAVRVNTDRGRVWVVGNTGPVNIETTYGDIRVMTEHPMTGDMSLVTKDASIDYRVPGGSTGLFHCIAKGGEVYSRILAGRVTSSSSTNGPAKFAAQVDGGTNPVDIRTTFGDIRVSVVDDPTDVGLIIFEP